MTIKLDFQTVKNLKQPGRYTDALVKGLHIWVKPNLNKYWIFRYTHKGKQHNISLGSFPTLSIAEARIKVPPSMDIKSISRKFESDSTNQLCKSHPWVGFLL